MMEDESEEVLIQDREYSLRFFKSPPLIYQFLMILLIGFTLTILLFDLTIDGFSSVALLFMIPTFLSAFILPYCPGYQEDMNFRQSTLLSLLSLLAIFFLLFFYISFGTSIKTAIIFANGVIISFRYLVLRSVFVSGDMKAIPPTFFQSILIFPMIFITFSLTLLNITLFFLVALVSLSSIEIFIAIVNRPFLSDFNISTLKMVRIAFQVFIGDEDAREELEEIFNEKSVRADIDYTGFHFVGKDKMKALFIVPNLHPGPIKGIGGYNLPAVLSEDLTEFGDVFVFHGPSTHSLNPVRNDDINELSKSVKNSVRDLNYDSKGTSLLIKDSGVDIGLQGYGDSLITSASFSPRPTEDIEAPIGRIVKERAKNYGFDKVSFIDAHNCAEKGCNEVYYPSRRAVRIIKKTEEGIQNFKNLSVYESIKMGTSVRSDYDSKLGIGKEGIKVSVFDIGGTKNAYVLVDGNNMVRGLRERIQEEISDYVGASEVFTTDSHEVNTLNKDYNPVGKEMKKENIIEDTKNLVKEALDDLETVKVSSFSGTMHDFPVMGPINTDRMNAVAETIYKMAPMTMILSFFVQALATLLILILV